MGRVWPWVSIAALSVAAVRAQDSALPVLRERAVATLRAGLASTEFWPAMHAAEGLTKAGLGADVLAALSPRLGTETDDQRRCGVARELVRAGNQAPVAVLTAVLADRTSNGRVHAAESLFKVHRAGDRSLLQRALDEGNAALETMAAAALVRQGDATALARVRARLSDAELANRRTAAWVLGQLGGPEDEAAIRRLAETETDPLSRSFFWNALARLRSAGALAVVMQNLAATDAGVRTYAAETLGVCGDISDLPRLADLLADPALDVRIRAAEAIVVITSRRQP